MSATVKPSNPDQQLVIAFFALFLTKEHALKLYNQLRETRSFWRRLLYLNFIAKDHPSMARFKVPELHSETSGQLLELFSRWVRGDVGDLEDVFAAVSITEVVQAAVHMQTCFNAMTCEHNHINRVLHCPGCTNDGGPEFLRWLLSICYMHTHGVDLPEYYRNVWSGSKNSFQIVVPEIWKLSDNPNGADV